VACKLRQLWVPSIGPSCGCGCVRIRFGEYGRFLDNADNSSKNVDLPHFLVS
jgi:hypothetical protein